MRINVLRLATIFILGSAAILAAYLMYDTFSGPLFDARLDRPNRNQAIVPETSDIQVWRVTRRPSSIISVQRYSGDLRSCQTQLEGLKNAEDQYYTDNGYVREPNDIYFECVRSATSPMTGQ
jgi:hypothetical protein